MHFNQHRWNRALMGIAAGLLAIAVFPLLGGSAPVAWKEFIVDRWETEDGLPENSATAMVQDKAGYLIFGTFQGLVMFDGVRFETFTPGNVPELPHEGIVNLFQDRAGQIWVSTEFGLVVRSGDRWVVPAGPKNLVSAFTRSFAEGPGGELYGSTFDGEVYRLANNTLTPLPRPSAERRGVRALVDGSGTLWAAKDHYLGRWDGQSWTVPSFVEEATGGLVSALNATNRDLLLIRTKLLVRVRDGAIVSRTPLTRPIPEAWSAYEDHFGDVWVATVQDGLVRIHAGGATEFMTTADGLSHNSLRFVFEDQEKNLWVGSSGGGLMRFTRRTFKSYGMEQGLQQRVVKSVAQLASGEMLAGTYGKGVMQIREEGSVRHPFPQGPSPALYVQSILPDSAGNLWVGTYKSGLHWWNSDPHRIVSHEESGGVSVTALFEDSLGRVWIGGHDRIACFDHGRFTSPGGATAALPGPVSGFAQNPVAGTVYAGSAAGLFAFDGTNWSPVLLGGSNVVSRVGCLLSDSDGTLWIGTSTTGLHRWKDGKLSSVSESNGLPTPTIAGMIDDLQGWYWLGSNRGILRVKRTELHAVADGLARRVFFQQFLTSDGLPSIECPKGFQPVVIRDAQKRLWFATMKGVAMVDPAAIEQVSPPSPVRIESANYVDRNGIRHTLRPTSGSGLEIPAGSVQFRINFTAFSYKAPEKLRFRYTLRKGARLIEQTETRARFASANLLPPGEYVFQVTAMNHDGIWSDHEASQAFHIRPYFWQTAGFTWVVCFLAMIVTGGTVWFVLVGRLRRQEERLEHASALAALNDQMKLASQAAGMGFWRLDLPSRSLETLQGHGPITGLPAPHRPTTLAAFEALVHQDDRARVREHWLRTFRHGEPFRIEFRVCPPGAPARFVSVLGEVQRQDWDLPTCVFGVEFDITDRIRLEENLRQAQKLEAVGRLAGGVAHDFNNLLTVIQGNLQLANGDTMLLAGSRTCLEEALSASGRAAHLTQQLLAFSRRQVLQFGPVDLNQVVESMVRMLHRVIREDITLRLNLAPELPPVFADSNSLDQVLMNLSVNARDAMPKGGSLTLSTSVEELTPSDCKSRSEARPGRFVRLSVADTGCGMSPQTLSLIFEPFFTTKEVGQGTGLGLSTVHGIVRQHQGWIEVASEVDRGTTFHVYLPSPDGIAPPPAARSTGEVPRGTETLLLAEDEVPVRRLIRAVLARQGYRVLDAADGPQALAIARSSPDSIALLVTDMTMPGGMSGTDLAAAVLPFQKGLRVLYISGYSQERMGGNVSMAVPGVFLAKPFTPEQLGQTVRTALDQPPAAAT